MKTIISMTFIGAALMVGSIVMGIVLGSIEFRGFTWKISTLCIYASIGGILTGTAITLATNTNSISSKLVDEEADDE